MTPSSTAALGSGLSGMAAATPGAAGPSRPSRVDLRAMAVAYRARVNEALRRYHVQHYPRVARRVGFQGTVLVAITIDPRGRIQTVNVKRSSGRRLLDRAALQEVYALGALPAPPSELRRRRPSLTLTLPMAYGLR